MRWMVRQLSPRLASIKHLDPVAVRNGGRLVGCNTPQHCWRGSRLSASSTAHITPNTGETKDGDKSTVRYIYRDVGHSFVILTLLPRLTSFQARGIQTNPLRCHDNAGSGFGLLNSQVIDGTALIVCLGQGVVDLSSSLLLPSLSASLLLLLSVLYPTVCHQRRV
ncbi:hypothetical protein VTK56DRAFT_1785 [Thermocarpiscus australiensis]